MYKHNHQKPEQSTKSKHIMKNLIYIILSFILLNGCEQDKNITNENNLDKIDILSVNPHSRLANDSVYNFEVFVNYNLASVDSGIIMIGFNNDSLLINSFNMDSISIIKIGSGTGTITFNDVFAKAKNWGTEGDFKIHVNLSENPHPDTWTPLTSDNETLTFNE